MVSFLSRGRTSTLKLRRTDKKNKSRSNPLPYLSGLHPESSTFLAVLPAAAREMSRQTASREGALVEAARWDAGRDEDADAADDSGDDGDAAAASGDRLESGISCGLAKSFRSCCCRC